MIAPDRKPGLLAIPTTDLPVALGQASDLVAGALQADEVDAFLYEPARDTLVAVGTSAQPLSEMERRHGLDILAVANGGRAVQVFQTGNSFARGGDLAVTSDPGKGTRFTLSVPGQRDPDRATGE